jgi:hypothetical protein
MYSLNAGGVRITGNLNEGVGDAAPGSAAAGQTGLPTVSGAYGQVGASAYISTPELVSYTNTSKSNATLYGGWYKYCKFKTTWSATLAIGQPLFYANYTDMLNHTVTADAAAAAIFAGFSLNATVTKGNYWWIQTGGIATVLCKTSSVTDGTAGDLAVQTGQTTATIDSYADATSLATAGLSKLIRGVFIEVAVADGLKRILMAPLSPFQ